MTEIRNVAILIFDEVEVLDFCGPFEVFSVAGRQLEDEPFNVYTVADTHETINARGGLRVEPAFSIDDCPLPDIVLVPGGYGTRAIVTNDRLLNWVRQVDENTELTLSVCTGSSVLGKAGLLDGLKATGHHTAFDFLRSSAPNTTVLEDYRMVDNGRVITSAGISAGIDMALYVVARLLDVEMAEQVARYMEYDWRPHVDGATIHTERLLLRPFRSTDLEAFHEAIWGDERVVTYLPGGKTRTLEETRKSVDFSVTCWGKPDHAVWAVIEPDIGRLIGQCGIAEFPDRSQGIEIFYALAVDCWGQGFATEMARACLRYGFEHFGLERIHAVAAPENIASLRVMEKLGMTYEGLKQYSEKFEEKLAYYVITRENFDHDGRPYTVNQVS